MLTFQLDDPTLQALDSLAVRAAEHTSSVHEPEFQRRAAVLAHELPSELRSALVDFRICEPDGALLISGVQIDDERIGPTPAHWYPVRDQISPALREEVIFCLLAQLLGDPFGYATLHNGLLVHNIIPMQAYADEQIAFGSSEKLEWHTEEAFLPHRADYTSLMCLRNPEKTPTTYVDIAELAIDPADREVLRQPLFATRPSGSHSADRNEVDTLLPAADRARAVPAFEAVRRLHSEPVVQPVLFGDELHPYVCLDPDCMTAVNEQAEGALRRLVAEVDERIHDVVLAPGEVLFIDNYRAIHGRKPFDAKFDGGDRWLKRMNIARDLRGTRARRRAPDARVVY